MSRIQSTNGKRVGYLAFDLSDGETSGVVVLRVLPATGYSLQADADVDVEIQARENGTADPFVDLATSPIDLSGYTPETPVDFDIRAVAGSPLVDVRRVAINLSVASAGAAAWS
jgi:hypothetical protein